VHTNRSQAFIVPRLAEWPVSRYDEAIVGLGFMVKIDELRFETRPASILLFNNFQTKVD